MNQHPIDQHQTETSSSDTHDRVTELTSQPWNRAKAQALADDENLTLTDAHWSVIVFLRKYYMKHGLPRNARTTADALNENFSVQGGNQYLYQLFSKGPITQGSRYANLRTPAYATDPSFGTSY
ncbi:TusE/DsrC/DsvC family sulfur relay protein [Thiohalobacter thiocyanaticus]|nr:TusE/DsrC/DsvC family sulfur relay protein [Thiohalobacter thiocyanaticus]